MSKFFPNILNSKSGLLNFADSLNQEASHRIKILELKRQKMLFDSKHKCMIEVIKTVFHELDFIKKFKVGSPLDNKLESELKTTVMNEIKKAIDYIKNCKNYLETNLSTNNALNYFLIEEKKMEVQIVIRMNYWNQILEEYLNKVNDHLAEVKIQNDKICIDEVEYQKQKTKIDDVIRHKAHFYQSLKRLEDVSINDYFNIEVEKIKNELKNTLTGIQAGNAQSEFSNPLNEAENNLSYNSDNTKDETKISGENKNSIDEPSAL